MLIKKTFHQFHPHLRVATHIMSIIYIYRSIIIVIDIIISLYIINTVIWYYYHELYVLVSAKILGFLGSFSVASRRELPPAADLRPSGAERGHRGWLSADPRGHGAHRRHGHRAQVPGHKKCRGGPEQGFNIAIENHH